MSNEFDLTLALLGHPVQTKDGRKVTDIKIVDENAPHSPHDVNEFLGEEYSQGITGVIHNLTGLHTYPFYHNGSSHLYGGTTEADLFMGENKTTSNNDTDCSGITLLRNPYGETYTYFISITGGSGSLSHNKISKVVQDNNYEQFIIHFINGMKHQSFHHTGRDYLITDQAINDISALIGSIFCYYTKKPVISVDNYDNVIEHFNIKKTGLNSVSLNVRNELLSNLQHNRYEEAVAAFILYIDDNIFTLSQTIINRIKSDIIVLINQLNTDVVTFDSKKVNTIIRS